MTVNKIQIVVDNKSGWRCFDFATELFWDFKNTNKRDNFPGWMLGASCTLNPRTCIKAKMNSERHISVAVVKKLADHCYFSLGGQVVPSSDRLVDMNRFFDSIGVRLTLR